MNSITENPIVTIGLPIFNGEKFLGEKLESIKNQTFENYKLIVSDNASDDETETICKEFMKKDNRVKYVRQNKNIGSLENFQFLLDQGTTKYFVWSAVDDLWGETFLEKNINFLENYNQYVGSISKVIKYGKDVRDFKIIGEDNMVQKKYKSFRLYFRPFQVFSLIGNQNERIKKFLKNPSALVIYAVFRTEIIKKCMVSEKMAAPDYEIILKILEFGEINVLNEILFKYNTEGLSSKGLINQYKNNHIPLIDAIFPYFNFINWARKKFGTKFIISNSRFFTLFLGGTISNIREIFSK